jgi:hypothetical protein
MTKNLSLLLLLSFSGASLLAMQREGKEKNTEVTTFDKTRLQNHLAAQHQYANINELENDKIAASEKPQPVKVIRWTKDNNGKFIADETDEISTPLTALDNPFIKTVDLQQKFVDTQITLAEIEEAQTKLNTQRQESLVKLEAYLKKLNRRYNAQHFALEATKKLVPSLEKEIAQLTDLKTNAEQLSETQTKKYNDLGDLIRKTSKQIKEEKAKAAPKKSGWLW